MKLSDIKTLQDVARKTGIPVRTLQDRLDLKSLAMIEGKDYKKLGPRLPTLLSPEGVNKILILNNNVEMMTMENSNANKNLEIPFKTHAIFIILSDEKIYKLNENFTKQEVKIIPEPSRDSPIRVLHKSQFDCGKPFLLDKHNPYRISLETANIYNKIGFLSDEEFIKFAKEY